MRLFIAIDLPDEIKTYLKNIQMQLPDDFDVRMRKVTDFHLTLKFLGEVEETGVNTIRESLSRIIFGRFNLKTGEVGVFKDKWGYVKVVWIGFTGSLGVMDLQKQVEKEMNNLGFQPEGRKFSPHLTLARVKYYKNKEDFEKGIKSIKTEPMEFEINSFSLIESRLGEEGAQYGTIEKYLLN